MKKQSAKRRLKGRTRLKQAIQTIIHRKEENITTSFEIEHKSMHSNNFHWRHHYTPPLLNARAEVGSSSATSSTNLLGLMMWLPPMTISFVCCTMRSWPVRSSL